MEVISQTHIQPTYSSYNLIYKRTAWRATTASLLILNSVYTKHMWHLKTLRRQTFKSSFSSPPYLDGVPAFPDSRSAPGKRVMPWERGREGGREQVLPWPGKAGAAHVHPAGTCATTCHQVTASAASDLPGLRLARCWVYWRCTRVGDPVTDSWGQQLCPLGASTDISLILVFQWSTYLSKIEAKVCFKQLAGSLIIHEFILDYTYIHSLLCFIGVCFTSSCFSPQTHNPIFREGKVQECPAPHSYDRCCFSSFLW